VSGTFRRVDREADPDVAGGALSPDCIEPATVLANVKAWPGNVSVFGKVGATASLDVHCARRRLSREAGTKKRALRPNKETDHAHKPVDFEPTI
jgi:hypothetical protein